MFARTSSFNEGAQKGIWSRSFMYYANLAQGNFFEPGERNGGSLCVHSAAFFFFFRAPDQMGEWISFALYAPAGSLFLDKRRRSDLSLTRHQHCLSLHLYLLSHVEQKSFHVVAHSIMQTAHFCRCLLKSTLFRPVKSPLTRLNNLETAWLKKA